MIIFRINTLVVFNWIATIIVPKIQNSDIQLVFSMDNSTITAEFKNVDDVKKFKNHAVDVYGLIT
jgi:hypothetical protein